MTRFSLTRLGTGVALSTAVTLALFAFDATPVDAAPAAPIQVVGRAYGLWDLPQDLASTGTATGSFRDVSGALVFTLDATLGEELTPALALRIGTIGGVLDDGSGFAWPRYELSGNWTAFSLTGQGTFNAFVSRQSSPSGPTFLIGTAGGRFRDFPLFPNQQGLFAGRWQATL